MAVRITGIASGLDTDSIVQGLVAAYSTKKDSYVKQQTKLQWKQDAWKDLNKKIYNLYSNTLGSMKYSSAYRLKKTSVSNPNVATASASTNAVNGTYKLKVDQLSQAGYLTGGKIESYTGDPVNTSTTLEDLGFYKNAKFEVRFGDGTTKQVELSASSTVANAISSLKSAGLTVNFDENNQRIYAAAQDSGKDKDFSFVALNEEGVEALSKLGLYTNDDKSLSTYGEWEKFAVYNIAKDANGNEIWNDGEPVYELVDGKKVLNENATKENIQDALMFYQFYSDDSDALNNMIENQTKQISQYTETNKENQAEIDYLKLSADERDKLKESVEAQIYKTDEAGHFELDSNNNKILKDGITEESDEYKAAKEKLDKYDKYDKIITNDSAESRITTLESEITTNNTNITDLKRSIANEKKWVNQNGEYMKENSVLSGADAADVFSRVKFASQVANGDFDAQLSKNASKVVGQDAVIRLNGVEYTSKSNNFTVNGLTLNTMSVTNGEAVDVTIATDAQGIYDKIKSFIKSYNELINEMDGLYNAASAKGYEPLTDDEKDKMTDKEIEKWEEKIKGSILRRDSTLQSVMSGMTSSMLSSFKIDGKNYSLSSFGIKTLGYFNAEDNEKNAFHIDGDQDDDNTKGNTDKLMEMISNDPDTVVSFFSQLSQKLYSSIDGKMKSSSLRSAYTVYNDKQMKKEYSDLSKTITSWEEKVSAMEEKYYKQFAAMETALSKLQSQTSNLTSMLGG